MLLPLIIIGVVVLSVGVFLGDELRLPACEYEKKFIALFKDIEAGNFIFVRIEQDGSAQFVNNIRYRSSINELRTGKIPIVTVANIFAKAEEINFWKMQDYYGPVDQNIIYEYSENNSIIISLNGRCKRVVFHGSRNEFSPLIDLVVQLTSSLPESNIYGTFINATDLFEFKGEKRETHKFTKDRLRQQYPELFKSILKPGAFIHINSDRENVIRSLAKGEREFYIKYKNKEFIIRLFERKKP